MRARIICVFSAAMLLCLQHTWAQNNIGNEQIDVVKAYQPMLSDAIKISDVPQSDTMVNYVPDMTYELPKVRFNTIYTISPIKAVKVKDDNIKKLYRGFVRGGYGTKNTPFIDAYFNSLRSKEYDAGAYVSHISSSGKVRGWEGFPGMSETSLGVFGSRFFSGNTLSGNIDFSRNGYHYYGYDDTFYEKDDTKHRFTDIGGNILLGSNLENGSDTRYEAGLEFGNFADNTGHKEGRFVFDGSLYTKLGEFNAGGRILADVNKYESDSLGSLKRNIFKIEPRFSRKFGRMELTAGLNIPIDANEKTNYYLLPHVRLDVIIAKETISAFAQLSGDVERTSYRSLSKDNPFIGNFDGPELLNQRNNFDLQAGVNIKIENQLAFIGSFALTRIKDDAFFLNYENIELKADSPFTVLRQRTEYGVYYDDNTRLRLHAELVYDQNEKSGISLAVDYESNKTDSLDKPLFRPGFTLTAKGHYNIGEKIYTKASIAWVDSRYYLKGFDNQGQQEYGTLDGYLDVSLGVDYRFSKVLSTFIQINNATASKYSRWYNYPSYRLGVFAGASYAF
ncbi:MAG: hypothetical protein ACKOKB_11300 [Bacteroidota bacterium]